MTRKLLAAAFAALGAALAGAATFFIGMRTKWPPVQDRVRRLNKRFMNPRQLAGGAGESGAWASVVHHVGRKSGRAYATPIGTVATDEGFVVVLPYGAGADWVRNVVAAGTAHLDVDGIRHVVDRPEVRPLATVAHDLSTGDRRMAWLFGIDEVLVLHRADAATPDRP